MLTNSEIIYEEAPIKASRKYSKIFNIYGDIPLSNSDIALRDILVPDINYSFFSNYLREGPEELKVELEEAVNFYTQRFGIDLNKFTKTPEYWISGEHRFYPYIKQGDYSAMQLTGNCCGLVDYSIIEGGFVLVVGAPGITARGSYGKLEGENIAPGSVIFFGYYILVEENNRGSIYHFRSTTPSITSSNTPLKWNLDVYDYKEKMWGKSIGLTIVDKKEVVINRPNISSSTSYVPATVPITIPTGISQSTTSVTNTTAGLRNMRSPAFPLTASPNRNLSNSTTIIYPTQTSAINSSMQVPTVTPVIREQVTGMTEEMGTNTTLITRSVITFGFDKICI